MLDIPLSSKFYSLIQNNFGLKYWDKIRYVCTKLKCFTSVRIHYFLETSLPAQVSPLPCTELHLVSRFPSFLLLPILPVVMPNNKVGNVFSEVCPIIFGGGSNVTITHGALDLTRQRHPASDIWRPSLEKYSNLFTSGRPQCWYLVAIESCTVGTSEWYASYWNAFLLVVYVVKKIV